MRYILKKQCLLKIATFYQNVAKKYKHTYSRELMHKNIDDAIDSAYEIEKKLLRRKPTIKRWAGYHMAIQTIGITHILLMEILSLYMMHAMHKTCMIHKNYKNLGSN